MDQADVREHGSVELPGQVVEVIVPQISPPPFRALLRGHTKRACRPAQQAGCSEGGCLMPGRHSGSLCIVRERRFVHVPDQAPDAGGARWALDGRYLPVPFTLRLVLVQKGLTVEHICAINIAITGALLLLSLSPWTGTSFFLLSVGAEGRRIVGKGYCKGHWIGPGVYHQARTARRKVDDVRGQGSDG